MLRQRWNQQPVILHKNRHVQNHLGSSTTAIQRIFGCRATFLILVLHDRKIKPEHFECFKERLLSPVFGLFIDFGIGALFEVLSF